MVRRNRITIVAIGSFLVGGLCVWGISMLMPSQSPTSPLRALRESDLSTTTTAAYQFIDPLIAIRGNTNAPLYSPIQTQVAAYIDSQKKNGLVSASVDFRDIYLPGGFNINTSKLYTPASLNKVPLMMAYYKIAETNPGILYQEVEYPGTTDGDSIETIKSSEQLTPGGTYSVEELIERMIRYSDNNAANLLTQHLKDTNNYDAYTDVFSQLGINPSVLDSYADNMTVLQYSIFLRALYNATYLNWADSERALALLAKTDFSEGVEGGVPNNIAVAQKFGEVKLIDDNGYLVGRELNNCGIIYYPDHPYLLCIMTMATGDNITALENNIAWISQIVYAGMEKLYPQTPGSN